MVPGRTLPSLQAGAAAFRVRQQPSKGCFMSTRSCAIVIVGASGDLARRKIIPALQLLHRKGDLDDSCRIIGVGRTDFSNEAFRDRFEAAEPFRSLLAYHRNIPGLRQYLLSLGSFSRVIFFLAQPPDAYVATACALSAEGLGGTASLIIEKPFGYDHASSRALNRELARCFDESRIFRIDHYLAKEAVQNILVFRFANALFYPVWNSRYVESIQISAIEDIGIFERGDYFDKAGIIRDMVQNHLFQLLSLLTMEAPSSLAPEDICLQKISLLRALSVESCTRFQYNGYRSEKGVAPDSTTETFAELKLRINTFRWTGMPIYLRTGKATHRKGTEIGVRFKPLPRLLYNETGALDPNRIIFKIQPAEGIILDLSSKAPGTDPAAGGAIVNTHMNFCYRDAFKSGIPEAYQRLLLDAIRGDRTLFVSSEETETAWKVLEDILDKGTVTVYEKGTLPASGMCTDWIDFERYQSMCG
ncbi:MAG: glucose-6-phosphate dehydrogenase [Chitinispirillaceae bacterium]|nr:glucose-6-phosphate dehydrogenase [Chitinispirillaceae bacterium]